MNESERHGLIVEHLRGRPFATVQELVDRLGASPATVRRDIAKLHAAGAVRKVFGGIAAPGTAMAADRLSARPFEENRVLEVAAKRAIAAKAATLCRDGDSIIIHGGTTCHLFALAIARRSLRVFTNSMPVAAALWEEGVCHLVVAGGDLHREPGILLPAEPEALDFYASRFFISCQGIGPAGLMESHPVVVRAMLPLLDRADEVVVLADSRKFSVRARHTAFSLSRIGTLITDENLADADARMLEDAGVKVVIAGGAA